MEFGIPGDSKYPRYRRYLAPPTHGEKFVLWSAAVVSGVAGCLLAWGMMSQGDTPWAFLLLGVAHAFVFGAALWFIGANKRSQAVMLLVCVLFPLWGIYLGMCGFFLFSAFLCSTVWGAFLWYLTGDRWAIYSMMIVGILPTVGIFVVGALNNRIIPEWYFPAQIAYWHVAAACAVAVLALRGRTMLGLIGQEACTVCQYPMKDLPSGSPCPECGYKEEQACSVCGYSLEGLPATSVCPECGYSRGRGRSTDEA